MEDPNSNNSKGQLVTPPTDTGAPVDLSKSSTIPPLAKVDPYLGKTFDGRYFIEQVLGEGGMGVVYRGKHKVIDKRVAIKVLRGEMAKDKEITERFLQEAKAASAIGNPHIIDISDFGQLPDGSTYFVMEFLAGKSLTDVMNEARPVPVPRLLHIAKQIATGLGAAHEAGIVHRDLKPDNVMLVNRGADKDFCKILDFGIAKVGGEGSRLTRAGSIFGTPHYMSPEQAAGTPVEARTDIYSFGVILYEMASGKVPFDADNFMGILTQHMYKKPPWIRELVPAPNIPTGLDAIIQKCLTKKPEGRYVSMGAVVDELDKVEKGLPPDALGEMMARSGGFNVPADYFRPSAMPMPVPATPAGVPKTGTSPRMIAAASVGAVALAAIAGVVYNARISGAQSTTHGIVVNDTTHAVPSFIAPAVTPGAPLVPPPLVPPIDTQITIDSTQVSILPEPPDAILKRDGRELGAPVLDIKPGEKVTLLVSHPGFKDKTIVVDASQPKIIIKLDRDGGAKPPGGNKPPANKPPTGSTPGRIDGVSDPWSK
jgi:tRNA A-37 threonylcarbamoyl transferase component Bud32